MPGAARTPEAKWGESAHLHVIYGENLEEQLPVGIQKRKKHHRVGKFRSRTPSQIKPRQKKPEILPRVYPAAPVIVGTGTTFPAPDRGGRFKAA